MGDHRASVKIEMEFHGIKDSCDMWINYYPERDGMDRRVIEFFESVYERGMRAYQEAVEEYEEEQNREKKEREERAELDRLKHKYEQG